MFRAWAVLAGLLPLSAFASQIPVIVDTDMDLDDAMAILFTLRDRQSRVLGITTVGCGFAQARFAAPNAARLTQLAGVPNLPVAIGADRSLAPVADFPTLWRVSGDAFFVNTLRPNPVPPVSLPAADWIVETLRRSSQKVDILALAPLTNLALALAKDPSIARKIRTVTFSGGAVDASGNVFGRAMGSEHPKSEWNVFLDAVAANAVLRSGVKVVMVPTDATDQLPLYHSALSKLTRPNDPVQRFLRGDVEEFYRTVKGTPRYWDPAAAVLLSQDHGAAVIRAGSFATKRARSRLRVVLEPGPDYGRTVRSRHGNPVDIVLGADLARFEETFYRTLSTDRP